MDFLNILQVAPIPGSNRTPFSFDTESVESIELGFKSEWLSRRLRVNVALFDSSYQDYQTNQLVAYPGGATVIQLNNAAEVNTSGIEISIQAYFSENLSINFDANYMNAEFDSFPGGGTAGANATGNELPYAPRSSGSLGVSYNLPNEILGGQISIVGQYIYRNSTYTGQENEFNQLLPRYQLVSGYIGWRSETGQELLLRANNITDKVYLTNRARDFLGTRTVTYGEPRTYVLEYIARF